MSEGAGFGSYTESLSYQGVRQLVRPAQKFTLEAPLAVCSRTNRPCRLVPAHQGMKMVGGRAVQRAGTSGPS